MIPTSHLNHLKDYRPPSYLIPLIEMTLELNPRETWVKTKLHFKKNPTVDEPCSKLFLNGEDLKLKSIRIDGKTIQDYHLGKEGLTLTPPKEQRGQSVGEFKDSFILETEVVIHPQDNTRLEGLYLSGEILCTQCEAEGFRRITYTLDRPDVLSKFMVTLIADGDRYPILLSNGNRDNTRSGIESDGRIREVFVDPFPKPTYLFAIVAGRMDELKDSYTTLSGREINLAIYSEPGKIQKCRFAMEALKESMKWEEEVYGLEYDLDDYKIVAIDAFNLGAMENKGLNIFNSALVFYDPNTATDFDREQIAATIAHEYFHNWTGNRVTIRDWFQLTLKEGLTVYRDRCFSATQVSPLVIKIRNAKLLRSFQFPEDNGPLSHPIQPQTYKSINNFYTLTVYEKGAEVVGMYETILGKSKFIHGVKQYLHYYDGQAVTVEDFFTSMQSMTQQDLSLFMRWYHTSGTPVIQVETEYLPQKKSFRVRLTQSIPQNPNASPLLIPLAFSVNVANGKQIVSPHYGLWLLKEKEEERTFTDIQAPPRLSVNENFSAPVKVIRNFTLADWIEQFYYEQNPFLKWDAFQQCYLSLFNQKMANPSTDIEEPIEKLFKVMEPVWQPISTAFADEKRARYFLEYGSIEHRYYGDCAFLSQLLQPPTHTELMEVVTVIDFRAIQSFIEEYRKHFVHEARGLLESIYTTLHRIHTQFDKEPLINDFLSIPDDPSTMDRGRRNLSGEREIKNTCLRWLARSGRQDWALSQFRSAQEPGRSNFNDELMALKCILQQNNTISEEASQIFYERWRKDNLVINRWLEAQSGIEDESTLKKIITLQTLPEFKLKEPNKCRALLRNFVRNNPFIFNHPSGEGYRIIADVAISLDSINPITASDLLVDWPSLERLKEPHKSLIRHEMERVQQYSKSKDVLEIVEKRLKS